MKTTYKFISQFFALFIILTAISPVKVVSQSADEIFSSVNDAIVVVEAYDFDGSKSKQAVVLL